MLFNSYEFIFLFLPIVLLGFYLLGGNGYARSALVWLLAASLFFYGWWNPSYLWLLVFSIAFNYVLGLILGRETFSDRVRRLCLVVGVLVNLSLLGYYKYFNFFVGSVNDVFGTGFDLKEILLPLAISFFTFQQIAYLVDTHRGKTKERGFLKYCLFVSFFPQLIAGPIVHYNEIVPQLDDRKIFKFKAEDLAVGLTIFTLGLFKKTVFADGVSDFANPVFQAAAQGTDLTFFESWLGAFAFQLQIYFDFSAYSDMAIGSARLFGILLPLNFNSPYKSSNISQFWNRNHMTLTRFLRDYLSKPTFSVLRFLPLGDKRHSRQRQLYLSSIVIMVASGIWHGSGWTFVVWGLINGVYLALYQIWRDVRKTLGKKFARPTRAEELLGNLIMLVAAVISLVFFRAQTFKDAIAMLKPMLGSDGISLPGSLEKVVGFLGAVGIQFKGTVTPGFSSLTALVWVVGLLAIIWFAPSTQQWLQEYKPALDYDPLLSSPSPIDRLWKRVQWKPTPLWGAIVAAIAIVAVISIRPQSEFLYFQF